MKLLYKIGQINLYMDDFTSCYGSLVMIYDLPRLRDENTRVFVFVRVQQFQKNECSCSFVFNISRQKCVRVRSCSGEHERTPVFALYVFVFVHPCLDYKIYMLNEC